jgi:small redox-active disulfide protein 2
MTVKILGSGCNKCKSLEAIVKEVVQTNNINAVVEKVTDLNRMISYGILITPGLVINEQVKSAGIIPSVDQILSWLREVD